jgi:cation:H+ antiporter
MPFLNIGLFFFGLIGLWAGSELLVRSSLKISKRMGLSETFIGLTMLAIGTDFPEIMVALTGAVENNKGANTSDIIVGNIIGSNMGQIGLVLGIAGLLKVLHIKKRETIHNGIMLLIATLIMFILSLDGNLNKKDGIIFLVLYGVYLLTLKKESKLAKIKEKFRQNKEKPIFLILELALGLLILSEASKMVIERGIMLASDFGVSQMMVGILLVGLGTSLPELVVSINAIIKGSSGLSVGNLIGSNIVDILVAFGSSATITTWAIDRRIVLFDMPYLLLLCVIVVLFLLTRERLERKESMLILTLYGIYVALKFSGW